MARKNYLIEGVSCSGKTSVCRELERRGYSIVDGDNELAYQGGPDTGAPTEGFCHEHHIWDVGKVDRLLSDQRDALFFCGGSRNFSKFIDRFDQVFVLDIDRQTLDQRLATRQDGEWGAREEEKALVRALHASKEGLPEEGVRIDASAPLPDVVDAILQHTGS